MPSLCAQPLRLAQPCACLFSNIEKGKSRPLSRRQSLSTTPEHPLAGPLLFPSLFYLRSLFSLFYLDSSTLTLPPLLFASHPPQPLIPRVSASLCPIEDLHCPRLILAHRAVLVVDSSVTSRRNPHAHLPCYAGLNPAATAPHGICYIAAVQACRQSCHGRPDRRAFALV